MSDHPNLATALAAFQSALPRLGKTNTATVRSDKGNYTYKYADLAEVSTLVLPLMAKEGLSFSAKPTLDEAGRFVLVYALRHSSGESDEGRYPLPANGTPQQVGSAITYARRYALCAIAGIAPDEDDDGQVANSHALADQEQEQQLTADAFFEEIRLVKTSDELTATSRNIRRALSAKSITKAAYDRLVNEGGQRRAELDLEIKREAEAAKAALEANGGGHAKPAEPAAAL